MLTGISKIDSLVPIGQGQNMLLLGCGSSAKMGVLRVIVANQRERETKVVWGCMDADPADAIADANANANTAMYGLKTQSNDPKYQVAIAGEAVGESASAVYCVAGLRLTNQPTLAILLGAALASAAASSGEHLARRSGNVLVIIDSIKWHKTLWEYSTKCLIELFGVDGVTKNEGIGGGGGSEERGFFSSLIQRAGRFNEKNGGGSLTLIVGADVNVNVNVNVKEEVEEEVEYSLADFKDAPKKIQDRVEIMISANIKVTNAILKKLKIPAPTDRSDAAAASAEAKGFFARDFVDELISMSDGQIWLDEALLEGGENPPIDPQRSITRIGIGYDTKSQADCPAMRKLCGGLR